MRLLFRPVRRQDAPRADSGSIMRFACWTFCAALLAFAAPAAAQNAADRTFGPARVGAIVKGVTKPDDLARIYGAANVKIAKMTPRDGGEEESPGAFVYQMTDDALQIGFSDDGKRILTVTVLGKTWKSKEGLRLGTPIEQLERINGGPFQLYGFGWDFGGQVFANGRALRTYEIFLAPTVDGGSARGQVTGEGKFSSRHPAMMVLRPEVNLITVTFGR